MDDNPEIDSWVMKETPISELIEDEKQKLLYVFDYMTERCFFIELTEIITGKDMHMLAVLHLELLQQLIRSFLCLV